jgi:signal transduction histidine kinase/DNA-binding response OmpR family regulator
VLMGGETMAMAEAEGRFPNGQTFWIDSIKTPITSRQGRSRQLVCVSIDITRQKKAEIALANRLRFEQASTVILQQLIRCDRENFPRRMVRVLETLANLGGGRRIAIYRTDADTGDARLLHSWQESGSADLAPQPQDLPAGTISWLAEHLEMHFPMTRSPLSRLAAEHEDFLELWGLPQDGALLVVPIRLQDERFGFLTIDSDRRKDWLPEEITLLSHMMDLYITVFSKIEAERGLTQAMVQARASSKAKGDFLANMSHEIRTPMNCVIGISELLMEMDPTPNQRQYLEMITSSGASLLSLINDILDLSKIEAGQLELDLVETNLRQLVEEVGGLIAFNAQAKGVQVVCRYAPGAPDVVTCDPTRLRQVLTNLLNNAVKFTTEGHIYLNVEPVGERDGRLLVKFQVTDTGIGIPQAKLDTIFEKFTQADTSTTRRYGGTGLGLSISRELIRLMDSDIEVKSVEGEGATFSFTIPVATRPDSLQAPTHDQEPSSRVLVISQHELGCEVLAEQVRHLGYSCTAARGSSEGIEILESGDGDNHLPWSFILVDQDVLPEDIPLIKDHVNRLPADSRPGLILLTSLSSLQREQEILDQGFNGTLTKPVRPTHLAGILTGQEVTPPLRRLAETLSSPVLDPPSAEEPSAAETGPAHDDDRTDENADGPLILLAEDNPFNQKVAEGLLKLLGCRVELAANGAEALERVRDKEYDLVFMDCQMPEMDGYEATRRIRKLPAPRNETLIVAMTANALSGDRNACFDAGMDDFLSKPVTKAVVESTLAKWGLASTTVQNS